MSKSADLSGDDTMGDGNGDELRKKAKTMESGRKTIAEDAQKVISTQRIMIETLKSENTKLKSELQLEAKNENIVPTRDQAERISQLQEAADAFTRRIEAERRVIDTLQRQMSVIDSRSHEARKKSGGMNKARDVSLQYMRQVKVLENRLEKSMVKLNEALQRNKELRMDIDNLRRERLNFQEVYRKMERELGEKKREMASIIEISNIAYEARDQAQNEIAALRAQADREQAAFEHEMAELNAMLEADLRTQEAERQKALLAIEMASPDNNQGAPSGPAGQVANLSASMRRSGVANSASMIGRRNSFNNGSMLDRRGSMKHIAGLEEAFQQISDLTGLASLPEIVEQFITTEDNNFKIFEHNQELNNEVEKLEEAVAELVKELEAMRNPNPNTAAGEKDKEKKAQDASRKELVKDLEDRASRTQERESQAKARAAALASQIESLKQHLGRIFAHLGCEGLADVRAQHSDILTQGVTDSNMMQYLGIIEKRASDVLAVWQHRGEADPKEAAAAAAPAAARHHEPLEILPPSTTRDPLDDEEGEGLDDEDRPLTRVELRAYAHRAMRAQGGGPAKERSNQGSRGPQGTFLASDKLALGRKR